MQKVFSVGAAAVAAVALMSSSASAMGSGKAKGEANLASPVVEETVVKVAGVTWTCRQSTCVGTGPAYSGLDDVIKECGKLSAAVGKLDSFKSRGRAVAGERLDRCNRLAGQETAEVASR